MMSIVEKPERDIEPRRKKAEMKDVVRKDPLPSFKADCEILKKKRKLEVNDARGVDSYKPFYTYATVLISLLTCRHFHFVLQRQSDKKVGQSSVYLQYCFSKLVDSGLLGQFTERITFWSDGCFKHNKVVCYASLFDLQSDVRDPVLFCASLCSIPNPPSRPSPQRVPQSMRFERRPFQACHSKRYRQRKSDENSCESSL